MSKTSGSEELIQKTCGGTMCQGLETLNIDNGRGYCCQGNYCNTGTTATVSITTLLFVSVASLFSLVI
uniref:UPAR/Ly6 domain-containing protein n=1 Tax=Syphacia muris TaxID=451379 RepID=A0A0N5ADR5_9BILA